MGQVRPVLHQDALDTCKPRLRSLRKSHRIGRRFAAFQRNPYAFHGGSADRSLFD